MPSRNVRRQFMQVSDRNQGDVVTANERIIKAKFNKAKELDLSGLGLSALPGALFGLTELRRLDLSGNALRDISASLLRLSKLRILDLSNNLIDDLSGNWLKLINLEHIALQDNKLTVLPPSILELPKLKQLSTGGNFISELRVSKASNSIKMLSMDNNLLTEVPEGLSLLNSLEHLDLTKNRINKISEDFSDLANLRTLDISFNELSVIPDTFGRLETLQALYLKGNPLKKLPASIGNIEGLKNLELPEGMSIPPADVVSQGTPSVLAYLRSLIDLEFAVPPYQAKLILVGQGNAGKTHLLSNLIDGKASEIHKGKTEGVEVRDLYLTHPEKLGTKMRLRCWDFGGQEIQHATHQFFLTDRSLFLLLWNARQDVGKRGGNLQYWLEMIKSRAPESPIIVVGTHADQEPLRVSLEYLRKDFPQIIDVCEISNITGQGVSELAEKIRVAASKLPVMEELWNQRWFSARDAIKALPDAHVPHDVMWRLMRDNKVRSDEETLVATRMHLLGDIVYFKDDPNLKHTVVLDPEWLTKRVCQAVSSDQVQASAGILTETMLEKIWEQEPPHVREELLNFMERYDLSYRSHFDRHQSIVAQALPDSPPEGLFSEWDQLKDQPSLRLKYVFRGSLPPGIPSWFIAREHRFTMNLHWRYGVMLKDPYKECRALVVLTETIGDVNVLLSVRGPDPLLFFNLLQDGFEETLSRYPGLDVVRKVPCKCSICNDKPDAFEFELDALERFRRSNKQFITCHKSLEDHEVTELLYAISGPKSDTVEKLNHIVEAVDRFGKNLTDNLSVQQRAFTKLFTSLQSTLDTQCPSVFLIEPEGQAWSRKLLSQPLKLRLCCEMPGCWHPVEDGGEYVLQDPAKWLVKVAPVFRTLSKVLGAGVPVAGASLGYLSPETAVLFAANLKLADSLAKLLPEIEEQDTFALESNESPTRATNLALQSLREFLVAQDPHFVRTGLNKVLMPEGNYLWLCDGHAKEAKSPSMR